MCAVPWGVQYLGDIMINVGDILSNVGVFSTEEYHEYCRGYHDAPGDIISTNNLLLFK